MFKAKVKAKDLPPKAKAKAKDLPSKAKAKAKDFCFVLEDTSRPRPRPRTNISDNTAVRAVTSATEDATLTLRETLVSKSSTE